jgi:hypothetical protein
MSGPDTDQNGPFFLHYVTDSTVAFSPACLTMDETLFSFELKHEEGQMPILEAEILNPGVGLLSAGRMQWVWHSWACAPVATSVAASSGNVLTFTSTPDGLKAGALVSDLTASGAIPSGTTVVSFTSTTVTLSAAVTGVGAGDVIRFVVPLFLGRMIGVPSGLRKQVIKIQFIARSPTYVRDRQAVGESLKIAPYYDPVFLDDAHRADVDAILEAWSSVLHIDRTTLAWSASDILIGEDGTATFSDSQILYDSVDPRIGEPPFTAVHVDMTLKWSQTQTGGCVNLGKWTFKSYSGSGFIADWPKAGSSIGGGWFVQLSDAIDTGGADNAPTATYSYHWQNQETKHLEGDTMSVSVNYTYPVFSGQYLSILVSEKLTSGAAGLVDASVDQQFIWVPEYSIIAYLYLQYKADRKRTEQITFTLQSDVQAALTDPTVPQDSEVLKLDSVSLSDPLLVPTAWTTLAGHAIALGQICLPNNPTTPGGTSFQICVVAGTAGSTEPTFSDTIGATTTDGTVTWASLGGSLPAATNDWQPSTAAVLGTLIAPQTPIWIYYSALLPPIVPFRSAGASVSEGTVIRTDNNLSYQVCTIGGTTGYQTVPAFSPVYGVTTNDGSVQWTSLGPTLPSGAIQMCVQAGVSALQLPPVFSNIAGTVVSDNTIRWVSLGAGGPSISIPAGGQVGNVPTRSYITSDRGAQSLQYAIMKARAHLRKKARCVEIDFEVPFALGAPLSCRMNAVIEDTEQLALFGGSASGKIISYAMSCNGDNGEAICKIRIGCAVGNGGTAYAVAPTDWYSVEGYVADGYWEAVGSTVLTAPSDVGYGPPLDSPNDDGLTFPLTADQVVLVNQLYGDPATQLAALQAAIPIIQRESILQQQGVPGLNEADSAMATQRAIAALGNVSVESVLAEAGNSVYLDLQLKPVTGSSFITSYTINTTLLQIPKQVDLAAA